MNSRSLFEVIRFTGELDISRKEELRAGLHIGASARAVLLDLAEVTYADSTALAELLRFRLHAERQNIPVAIVATSVQFTRVIQYAGLHEAFNVFSDRGEALSYLEGAS